jgi:hypothetical protein
MPMQYQKCISHSFHALIRPYSPLIYSNEATWAVLYRAYYDGDEWYHIESCTILKRAKLR